MKLSLITLRNAALAGLALTTALSTGAIAAESDDAKSQTPIKHIVVIFLLVWTAPDGIKGARMRSL